MSKLKLAEAVMIIAFILGAALALGVLWGIISLFVMWANAHWISFAWVMGIGLIVGVVVGIVFSVRWALGVMQDARREEEAEQRRVATEKKKQAYKDKWGEEAIVPTNRHGIPMWDQGPETYIKVERVER